MIRTACLGFVFLGMTTFALGEDWPTWRHDRMRSAVTSEKLAPPLVNVWMFRSRSSRFAPAKQPNRSDRSLPPGKFGHKHGAYFPLLPDQTRFALPITAAGGSLFFTTAGGRVVCIEAAGAKVKWEFIAGAAISQTANVFGGKVYVGSDDGYVYCLDAKTGALVWRHKAAPADRWFLSFGRMTSKWPVRTDVVVDDGAAYFGAGVFPHDGMFINKINALTGKRIWRSECRDFGVSGPVLLTKVKVYLQIDTKGFGSRGWHPEFRRSDGVFDWTMPDPETYAIRRPTDFGSDVIKDGIRYTAFGANETKGEHERGKRKTVWNTPMPPGRFPDGTSFIYAGETLYFLANDAAMWGYPDARKGYGGAVFARDPKTGKDIWSFSFPERPFHLIVANGRLFVSTRGGTIYAFAPKGTPGHGIISESMTLDPFPKNEIRDALGLAAHRIIEAAALKKGYALVLDCDSGALAYDLANRSDLYVCAVFGDAQKAKTARERLSRANVLSSRISVWHQEPGTKLPYPSNFADMIVSEAAAAGGKLPEDLSEINRLLKPIRGIALIGGKQEKAALDKWTADTKQKDWTVFKKHEMHWAKRVRPPMPNAGGWVGAMGGPGRTNCSHDAALKGPLGVVWYGPPYINQSLQRPPLIANGVMICPTDVNTVEAYDQYNGRLLWRHTAPNLAGQLSATGSAGGDYVFMTYNGRCVRLDLWNGGPRVYVPLPFQGGRWGQLVVSRDGKTLWGVAHGKDKQGKDWRGMFALDAKTDKVLWKQGGPGKGVTWGGWNAIGDGRIYIIGSQVKKGPLREQAIAEMHAYLKAHDAKRLNEFEKSLEKRDIRVLTALDAATGEVLYRHGVDLTNRGSFLGATGGTVVFGRAARWMQRNAKHWGASYRSRPGFGLAAFDGATGRLLWNERGDFRFRPVVTSNTIYAEPWAYDLRTGKRKRRTHPITGEPSVYVWARHGKHCGGYNGSENFIFGRNYGVGYHDTLNDSGMYTFMHSRNNCTPDVASGGGMMIKPPLSLGCRCPWSLPFTVAMAEAPVQPVVPFMFFSPGRSLPVKHLRLNFGETGDRRDKHGGLWLRPGGNRPGHMKGFTVDFGVDAAFYPGADWFHRDLRRSAVYTPIENTDTPLVFASAVRGLKRCIVPVTTAAHGKGFFTVKLGFSAPPGDKPGQRVFDVKLNGKTVLEDFDIIKEAGKTDRAVWKTFELELDGNLVLDLIAKSKTPTFDQMPVMNGLQVIRKEMTTLGFEAPKTVWLNRTKPDTVTNISVANLRGVPFKGKLVVEAPRSIEAVVAGGSAIDLQPGARKRLAIRLKAGTRTKVTTHLLTVKIVSEAGKVELARTLAVEWLGGLERKVLRGGSRCIVAKSDRLRWLLQNRGHLWMKASKGARKTDDDGAAYSCVWFGIPNDVGKIRRARLRLHTAPNIQRTHEALFEYRSKPGRLNARRWGTVKQVKGPPWPDFNKMQYPKRPETLPATSALRPTEWDPNVVEAAVPGDLKHIEKSHQVRIVIEPTALGGQVYWSTHHEAGAKAAVLVIDYEPKKKDR